MHLIINIFSLSLALSLSLAFIQRPIDAYCNHFYCWVLPFLFFFASEREHKRIEEKERKKRKEAL
jgi:hypothetical protein